jgi:hypothetical protein
MSSIGSHVARVRRLFGHLADDVSRLALRNQRFRSLCDDYGLTIEALEVLERRNHPMDVEKMAEYRALRRELERDLEHELLASSSKPDD